MKRKDSPHQVFYESPIGWVQISGTPEALTGLVFFDAPAESISCSLLDEAVGQVQEYFSGKRTVFDLPLETGGTDFQQQVWSQLRAIPFGSLRAYQDIANILNNPKAVRAVGMANGQNPISVIIPCHRVIGSDGKLTGYGGGLWRKEWLLRHEGALLL
jgi:methylated-DNA-[protein]-cysteine S-methyltransferase